MKGCVRSLVVACVLAGCGGGSDEAPAAVDASSDVGATDAAADASDAKSDSKPADTALPLCDDDLGGTFVCPRPTKVDGQKTCDDAALDAYIAACHKPSGSATASACKDWKTKNAACATCTDAWTYKSSGSPARDYCYYRVMTTSCANAVACYFGCVTNVCAACAAGTENLDCQKRARVEGGRCWDYGYKTATAENCFDEATLDPCTVSEYGKASPDPTTLLSELRWFYRGACREGANWAAARPIGGDAGPEAGPDAGEAGTPSGDAATD